MARTLLLAGLVAATLLAPLASAGPTDVDLPDSSLFTSELVVGGFCVERYACVDAYCVERASVCCPRIPPSIDPRILRCSAGA